MLQKFNFENCNKKPINELFFSVKENGVILKIPALSKHWVERRCYTNYTKLNLKDNDEASINEWLEEVGWFNKDLKFLLNLEHFRFWSYMVYEERCIEIIVGFLQEAIPYYMPLTSITTNDNVVILYLEVLQNVLRILCRLITNKESDEAWMKVEDLAQLLYSKFLITIPMIFDIIIAYGRTNFSLLSKVIKTIFKIEPKYNADLKIAMHYLQKTFIVIKDKIDDFDENIGEDLALYTLDCASTLSILLELLPNLKQTCREIQLEQSISKFYDNAIPLLYKNIYTINDCSKSLEYLNLARVELLKAFRSILYLNIEEILQDPKNSIGPSENFISILTECLADRTFVIDYQRYYPIESDIDILKQACKDLDTFKADFVLKAYTSEAETYVEDITKEINDFVFEENEKNEFEDKIEQKPSSCTPQLIERINGASHSRDISAEVLYVLEMLPYLGDGFVRKLLLRYDNVEQAITAILENNLPPDLADADKNEIYIPDESKDIFQSQFGIERSNVFNGDQYDVLLRDNPNCIIKKKKGFPGQPKNLKQLLDDKSHVKEMKQRYQEYSLVDHEYEDEYDDSYEALADSEAKTAKSKLIESVIANEIEDKVSADNNVEDESGDDEDNQYNDGRDRSKDFCENPEVIRARYEASRNAKYANRANRNKTQQKQPSEVIVGKPKGQGQDKDTLKTRHNKEVNKSSRANHNRKSGASWKRSRGMVPS